MLIDGHPQFMGIMGHPLPDSYVASDAERVEVIRGPASILYGTNAMGGVINIITKSRQKKVLSGNAHVFVRFI
jgi:outer membrane receptor for ferrienterochelin and colicin